MLPRSRPVVTTTGAVSIAPFADCEELRDYYVQGALDVVGSFGFGGSRYDDGIMEDFGMESSDDAASEAGDAAGGPSASDGAAASVAEDEADQPVGRVGGAVRRRAR